MILKTISKKQKVFLPGGKEGGLFYILSKLNNKTSMHDIFAFSQKLYTHKCIRMKYSKFLMK